MQPLRQPVLAGTRVTLRPTVPADRDALYAVASDPLVWEMHPAHDRWRAEVFDAFFDAGLASGGMLTIRDADGGAVSGSSRFDNFDAAARTIEIGWTFLARSHWRTGHNREAKRLMLDHCFQAVDTVVFTIGENNRRSRAAVEAIGAVERSGRIERVMAGVPRRHVVYEVRRA